ncbi:MAG: alpha/beta fold hydrolase [Parachlamydiales bacterium]|nr:alpha/beta fold hydrolase [Parachlamydiales bacterium]
MKKIFFWILSLSLEAGISLATFLLPIFKKVFFKNKKSIYQKTDDKTILLVHGYLHNEYIWFYHEKKLKEKGFSVYTVNLKNPFSSIRTHAEILDKKIKEIKKNTNISKIILIGHSMGGLVSSYYALNIDQDNLVTDIFTIASPLYGTLMANFGIGKCAKEMKRNSNFTNELTKKIENEKNINFYHIATKKDQLVVPYTSCLVGNNKDRQYVIDNIGHATLLYSKKVNDKILSWLLKKSDNRVDCL